VEFVPSAINQAVRAMSHRVVAGHRFPVALAEGPSSTGGRGL